MLFTSELLIQRKKAFRPAASRFTPLVFLVTVFWSRSPKYMVHLSTHSGLASSSSISAARLFGVVSATKLSTRAGSGMRPVRSKVARRINSQSVVIGAGVPPSALKSASREGSIEPASCVKPKVEVELPGGGDATILPARVVNPLK